MPRRVKAGDPGRAVGYLRVSTDEQRLGPEAQRGQIEAWAAREGAAVVAWHIDQGVSGGSELDARPGLAAALATLRAEGAGVLAIAKRDRLARDVAVAATIERAVAGVGARIIAADGAGNGDEPAEQFMRRMLDAAAEYERGLIRARTRAALAVKRARGERTGTVPYGYRLASDGRTLEPDPYEQEVLAFVRAARTRDRSLREIVADLAAVGHRSRVGTLFGLTQVAQMERATRAR